MFQLDPSTGSVELPIWISAALMAVFVALVALALARSGLLRTLGVLVALAVFGYAGWFGWNVVQQRGGLTASIGGSSGVDDRREFDRRVTELIGRAMLPGSPLACLDGNAGEQVAIGCEKLIFSGPETISAAVTYVAARLAMLAEGLDLARQSGAETAYGPSLNTLRRGLESDRFGIVAYLMLQRPDCTVESCEALSLFRDANRVRANLVDRPFDVLVTRYSANWQLAAKEASAGASVAPTGPAPANGLPPAAPVSSKYDFPSSDSIPPVSIMNPEPAAPPAGAAAPAKPAPAETKPAPKKPAARRAPAHAPAARASAAPSGPTQLAPANVRPPAGDAAR